MHTPIGLVERGVKIFKTKLRSNIKAGEFFGNALDLGLAVMRTTPHTWLMKPAFELHFGREQCMELSKKLKIDEKLTGNYSISAKTRNFADLHIQEKWR